jgi:hypothetical protein
MKWALGFLLTGATLLFIQPTPAYACWQGESQCNGGYLYICKCWTSSGCRFEYSGRCRARRPNFHLGSLNSLRAEEPPVPATFAEIDKNWQSHLR